MEADQRFVRAPTLREVLTLALPMMASTAAETVMLFTDRLFLSMLGKEHIAAAMSGGLSSFVFTAFFLGLVSYVNVLCAQYHGAGRPLRTVQSVSQGMWIALAASPLVLLCVPPVLYGFAHIGHHPLQVQLESQYFSILMAGAVFSLLRTAFGSYFLGIGKSRIVMLANIAGMVVNIPLNALLIFGAGPIPPMGIAGAAIGTIGGSLCIFVILLIAYLKSDDYCSHRTPSIWKLRWELVRRLLRFGTPAGVEMFMNVFAFNVFLQLMHSYGSDVAAAVTITFSYDMVSFIPLLGIGSAVTALVGQRMGAGSPTAAAKAIKLSLLLALTWSGSIAILFISASGLLVQAFGMGMAGESSSVMTLAQVMLASASLYLISDAVHVVLAGGLRGAGDTRWVMIITVSLHYLFASLSVIMIKLWQLPASMVWSAFIVFAVSIGVAMFLRYRTGAWKHMKVIEETVEN